MVLPFPIWRSLKNAGVPNSIISAKKASAIVPEPVVAHPQPPPATTDLLVLRDGTPVRLRLYRNLSSADAITGDTVDFEVLEDLTVDGMLVIARRRWQSELSPKPRRKGEGTGWKLDVEIDYVRLVNGDKVSVRAAKEGHGDCGVARCSVLSLHAREGHHDTEGDGNHRVREWGD